MVQEGYLEDGFAELVPIHGKEIFASVKTGEVLAY